MMNVNSIGSTHYRVWAWFSRSCCPPTAPPTAAPTMTKTMTAATTRKVRTFIPKMILGGLLSPPKAYLPSLSLPSYSLSWMTGYLSEEG